jgi:uncharacterized caspase-like protein
MRFVATVAAAVMLICFGVLPGHADKRVALVIGNGDYQHADKLANPVTDARRLRDALAKLGFEIVYGENLGKQALERTIGRFANVATDADVALVYFAGHGATFGDIPYVVPVDAQFSSFGEVPYELVPVETLIGELRRAKGVRIAILDACRDDTAERELKRVAARGGEITRGLARVKNPEGLILAYATQYLSTAADGDPNGDSPFTTALLNNIATPGLDVKELFFKVGSEVISSTKGGQRPEISVSFYDFYTLVPAGPTPVPLAPMPPASDATPGAASVGPARSESGEAALELTFWNSIKNDRNPRLFEAYLKRYPNGTFADIAKINLDELKTAALTPPFDRPDDKIQISDPGLFKEVRERLYELNFDPGPFDGPNTETTRQVIREFEQQNNLTPTGAATQGLLRRLREIGGLKPWGAIVYAKDNNKWGMSWGEGTRTGAIASARASCGDAIRCPIEVSFFGTECGVFAHSESSWAITARDDIRKAKEAALSDCKKRGKACRIVAGVCADGAERFSAAK